MFRQPGKSFVSLFGFLALLATLPAFAADVITEGDMEIPGTDNWPHTDITATNSSNETATDQVGGGTYSLKGTSPTLNRALTGWYNDQTVGSISATDSVELSLWWGIQWSNTQSGANGTLYVDVKPTTGTWAADSINLWTQAIAAPSTSFQSGTVTNQSVGASITVTQSYDFRVRFEGKTGRNGTIMVWWDNIVLDVTGGNTPPTVTINNPADAGSIGGGASYVIDGTSADSDGTVQSVDLEIQRGDNNQYWNGSAWQAGLTTVAATNTGTNYSTWNYTWNWTTDMDAVSVSVTATATDDGTATGTDTNTTTVDTQAPQIATGVRFQPLPTSGDASFTLLSDWTEANPGTPQFAYFLNAGPYTGWLNGSAGNSSSLTYAVGLTGSDWFQGIRSQHTDTFTNGPTESEDVGPFYVLPLTPSAPTVANNGTTDSLDLSINAGAETGTGMLYAIQCNTAGGYLTAGHVCGGGELWQTTAAWGTIVVTALSPGTTYNFSVAAGNPNDATPTTGERSASAYSTTGSATTDAGNTPPTVTITAPPDASSYDEGVSVSFTGTASDAEDGDLTASLAWTSSLDGSIGTGGSFSRSDLSVGSHTITASVTDNGALSGQDQVGITINAVVNDVTPSPPTAVIDNCNQITVSVTFTGDANNNSTTLFERSPNGTDSWAAVTSCGAGNGIVSGASPRTCVDTTVADNSTNYYRTTFSDVDGVGGVNPSNAIGPYDTSPYCSVDGTTVNAPEAEASSCSQITVLARFTGDDNGNGSTLVESSLAGQGTWTTACGALTGASPRQCVVSQLAASTAYDIKITYTDPDGVANGSGTSPQTLTNISTLACGTYTAAPTLLYLVPTRDAILGGTDAFKVQVFHADLGNVTVQWSVDQEGDTGLAAASQNANYDCGTNCAVYEFNVDMTGMSQGSHWVTVKATHTPESTVGRLSRGFQVNNSGGKAAGDGLLLRRTRGSQLCIDCHNLKTHSSESTSTKYGNWAMGCDDCHTPHMTTNIYLIPETIRTPNSGERSVRFEDRTGAVADSSAAGSASFVNEDNASQADGPCQACHTRTESSGGDARWRNASAGGNVDTHYTSVATSNCIGCHTHDAGFSGAGGACDSCHFAPPTVGRHGTHDETGTTPTDYANLTSGATATEYGFACAKCHSGTHFSDPSKPHTVEVVFDATVDPKNAAGTYTAGTPQTPDPGVNGDGWNWSDGTCNNLYCHSNASPLGGSLAYQSPAPTWNATPTSSCVLCHDGAGAATGLSAAHPTHTNATTYQYGCVRCHTNTVSGNTTVSDKQEHVDGQKDVFFDTTGPNNSGGNYNSGVYSCSNTYCHSDGTDQTAPYTSGPSIAWNTTATCRSCHDGDAGGSPTMNTNKHGNHVNNASVIGTNYECAACHDATVTAGDNETVTNFGNHVDATSTVSGTLTDNSYVSPTCDNAYCHSSGQDPTVTTPANSAFENYSQDWTTGTLDCSGCHGRHTDPGAFTSTAGEPNYANAGAGADAANSHDRHVTAAADCTNCHNSTTANGTQISSGSLLHTDQTRDVVISPSFDNNGGTGNYTPGTKTCNDVACHGTGTPQWGATLVCLDCHDGPDGGTLGDGTPNGVGDEWTTDGHGSAAGGSMTSALDGCDYCHQLNASHTPTAGNNPYRTRFAQTDNTLCLQCHLAGDSGISQNSEGTALTAVNSTKNVDTAHFGAKHEGTEGGKLCWDCHDPHGVPSNILMVKSLVSKNADQYGIPGTTVTVNFTDNTTAGIGTGRFVDAVGPPRTGICQACHDPSGQGSSGATNYWHSDGSIETHNPTKLCSGCHAHTDNFKGAGACLDCHADHIGPTGATVERVQIIGGTAGNEGDDFIRSSRHVSDGTTTSIVTNFDCIVCHAEGDVSSTTGDIKTNPTYHGADGGSTTVDLRDVDAVSGAGVAAQWPGSRLGGAGGAGTTHRDGMDSFCLGCHDSDTSSATASRGGAWGVAVNSTDTGLDTGSGVSRRLTPFNTSDNLTNARETSALDTWRTTNNKVIDVRGQFNYQNLTGKNWASHHNLNQFTKRYGTRNTTAWPNAAWTTYTTKEGDNIQTAGETAGLHCSDCHLNESNAHGTRNTWYMLSNSSGNDTAFQNVGELTSTDICSKCHANTTYGEGGGTSARTTAHDGVCARVDAGAYNGIAMLGATGAGTGSANNQLTCLGCHGGLEPGMIHGTNSTYNPYEGGTSSPRYRFMGSGGSMRWYSPVGSTTYTGDTQWEGTSSPGCYTIGAADTFGSCDQHGGGKTNNGFSSNRARPLNY